MKIASPVGVILLAMGLLALAACKGPAGPEPMTLEEYVAEVCTGYGFDLGIHNAGNQTARSVETLEAASDAVVKDVRAEYGRFVENLKNATPPAVLADYHQVVLNHAVEYHRAMGNFDQQAQWVEVGRIFPGGDHEYMVTLYAYWRESRKLSDSLEARLVGTLCITYW